MTKEIDTKRIGALAIWLQCVVAEQPEVVAEVVSKEALTEDDREMLRKLYDSKFHRDFEPACEMIILALEAQTHESKRTDA